MKKVLSLAVLTAVLAGCTDLSTTDTSTMNGYGADGFGEETLVTTDESLNNTYLLAPAPKYYVGSAYKVEDVQYIPVEDLTYNQTGIAGIIPAELNGTKTSNGEVFDMSQMVATSKTLPLPTIARVTNLDNGQSVVVRVNNRGPFVNTLIIDLSPAAAQKNGKRIRVSRSSPFLQRFRRFTRRAVPSRPRNRRACGGRRSEISRRLRRGRPFCRSRRFREFFHGFQAPSRRASCCLRSCMGGTAPLS